MGIGPWRPITDIERHLQRGELDMAIAVAHDTRRAHGRPIPLNIALKFLPAVARHRPEHYSAWALRWLADWLPKAATIDQALDVTRGPRAIAQRARRRHANTHASRKEAQGVRPSYPFGRRGPEMKCGGWESNPHALADRGF